MRTAGRVTRSLAGAALLAVVLVPDWAAAQEASPSRAPAAVAPGARVRVTAPGGAEPRVGTLVALTPDTLTARWATGDSGAVALAEVTGLEVSRGLRGRPWRGAGLGFLGGAVIGAVWGAKTYEGCNPQEPCIDFAGSDAASATAGAIVLGAAGALVGGVVGALWRAEAWRPVALERGRVGLVTPARGRVLGVRAALAF